MTLKRQDGRIITINVTSLHENDRAWVRSNVDPGDLAADAPPPKGAAFDQLEFGDDRGTVEKKLKATRPKPRIEPTLPTLETSVRAEKERQVPLFEPAEAGELPPLSRLDDPPEQRRQRALARDREQQRLDRRVAGIHIQRITNFR